MNYRSGLFDHYRSNAKVYKKVCTAQLIGNCAAYINRQAYLGKERKGKERKGKERKGKERVGDPV